MKYEGRFKSSHIKGTLGFHRFPADRGSPSPGCGDTLLAGSAHCSHVFLNDRCVVESSCRLHGSVFLGARDFRHDCCGAGFRAQSNAFLVLSGLLHSYLFQAYTSQFAAGAKKPNNGL